MAADNSGGDLSHGRQSGHSDGLSTPLGRGSIVHQRRSGLQRWLRPVAGALIALAVGTLFAAQATPAISLQLSPEQVVRQYVQVLLSEGDTETADTLVCRKPHLEAVTLWQKDLTSRETRFHLPPLQADVTAYADTVSGHQATASVEISVTLVIGDQPQERLTRPYDFSLVQDEGWKICKASQRL
jgi:hypothetical protein